LEGAGHENWSGAAQEVKLGEAESFMPQADLTHTVDFALEIIGWHEVRDSDNSFFLNTQSSPINQEVCSVHSQRCPSGSQGAAIMTLLTASTMTPLRPGWSS